METKRKYFKLYSHNIPVRGISRSAIYDLQQCAIRFIPNILCDILQELSNTSIDEVQQQVAANNPDVFQKYITYLLEKDFGFLTNDPEHFPQLNLQWQMPCEVQSAVVQYSFKQYDLEKLFQNLDDLLCRYLELRIEDWQNPDNIEILTEVLSQSEDKVFRSINLWIPYTEQLLNNSAVLFDANKKINYIIVYNTPFKYQHQQYPNNIIFVEQDLVEMSSIGKEKYIVNIHYFSEAQKFNPYYNKKVCIDYQGNIKNDLYHERSFGNIVDNDLLAVVRSDAFQELWNARPDEIIGVKDSELRYCMLLTDELTKDEDSKLFKIKNKTSVNQAIMVS
jgi:SPASM domain peptide maturase of grasp-with-spasm system